jgi:hypothetical protein
MVPVAQLDEISVDRWQEHKQPSRDEDGNKKKASGTQEVHAAIVSCEPPWNL